MANVTLTGTAELQRALTQAGPLALAAFAQSAVVEQEKTMAEAKAQTPVDLGTLRASGHVEPPKVGPANVSVTAGFGGGAADYAIYVHEIMTNHHPVGNAKFLERPFLERAPQVVRNLAEGVAKAWLALRG